MKFDEKQAKLDERIRQNKARQIRRKLDLLDKLLPQMKAEKGDRDRIAWERAAQEAKMRAEALRPDKEKLMLIVENDIKELFSRLVSVELESDASAHLLEEAMELIWEAGKCIAEGCNDL